MAVLGAKLEPELFPTMSQTAKYRSIPAAIVVAPGRCYENLLRKCSNSEYSIVFILPWLTHGGADKEAIDLINAVAKTRNKPVLVILSERAESPWATRLHHNASVLSLDSDFHILPHSEQMLLLATLVQNVQCKQLHVVNSKTGWALIQKYGKALSQTLRITAHLFCESVGERGELYGYGSEYLRSSYPYVTTIVTDSQYMIEQMIEYYAIPLTLFQVLRQRTDSSQYSTRQVSDSSRVLWAGRLDRQKRPDILVRVAKLLPSIHFDVYGRSVLDDTSVIIRELRALPNVTMFGEYEDFAKIVQPRHYVFMYTSAWDGFPNVLIEAASASLPIVAPAVGGIPEILNDTNSYLLKSDSEAGAYAEAINTIISEYKEATNRARSLHETIHRVFNSQLFDRRVAELFQGV